MKKHNLLKVLLIMILVVVLASWILPVTDISDAGSFETTNTNGIGLFTLANYFSIGIQIFRNVPLYILAVGGLYGVLHKIPQYRILLDKIVEGFDGKESWFMIIVGVFIAILSSMAGLSFPIILLFPFVISIILLMGYDKITAAMLTVGSVVAGLIGTVFSNFGVVGAGTSYAPLTDLTNQFGQFVTGGTYGTNENVWFKLALLVFSIALVLINTIIYAKKHRNKNNKVEGIFVPEKVETKNKSIMPLAIILDLLLVVIILAFISWSLFNIDVFDNITKYLVNPTGSDFSKGIYNAFNSILGLTEINSFGNWTLVEASLTIVLASGLIAFVYRKSFNTYISSFVEGVKKAVIPALLIAVSLIILVISVDFPLELTILRPILDLNGSVNIFVMGVVALFFSIFIVDPFYVVYTASPYIASVVTASSIGLTALIWQSMYGLTMLIAPTSFVLLATLSYLGISYGKWLKSIWKLLLELLAVIILVLLIF